MYENLDPLESEAFILKVFSVLFQFHFTLLVNTFSMCLVSGSCWGKKEG